MSAKTSYEHVPPHLRDTSLWPLVDLSLYPEDVQEHIGRLRRGITLYLKTGELAPALEEAHCSKDKLYAELARCLTPCENERGIVGWIALVPHLRVVPRIGQFGAWLCSFDKSRDLLHRLVLSGNGADKIKSRKPTVRGVAQSFLSHIEKTVPEGTYPNDGTDVIRSIQRYVKSFVARHMECTGVWFGEEVAKRQNLGSGRHSFDLSDHPFSIVGADGYRTDSKGIVYVPGPVGRVPLEVERMQVFVILAIQVRTVLGYGVCLERELGSRHVEEAFVFANTRWQPQKLKLGDVAYDPGAGFPVGVIEGLSEVNPDLLTLDNASIHYAKGVQQRLRETLGCTVSWGAVGHWWRHGVVERLNGELARSGFQRLPSSTGSGPLDPLRGDPASEAIRNGIDIEDLMQLLDVLLANRNAQPQKALGGLSGLEATRSLMKTTSWVPRIRPPSTPALAPLGVEVLVRRIAGSVERGRAPYVEVDEQPYSSPVLSAHREWIGRKVLVHVPKDMRNVDVYFDSGEHLGTLEVNDKGWRRSPHGRSIRKAINRLIRKRRLKVPAGGDPVVCYLEHLSREAQNPSHGKSRGNSVAAASRLAEVQRVTGVRLQDQASPSNAANKPVFNGPRTALPVRLPSGW